MDYQNEINSINQELTALENELGGEVTQDRLAAIEARSNELKLRKAELIKNRTEQVRQGLTSGTPVEKPESDEEKRIKAMTKRERTAFAIGVSARGKAFTDVQKRALGKALTTTATTYTAASGNADGVNNAGVLISTKVIIDLLKDEGVVSPIFDDIMFTEIKGQSEFPYRISRTKANAKAEGSAGEEGQMKWGTLTGVKGYLQTIIAVTDEVLALTDFDFGSYILEQFLADITDDFGSDCVYGSGSNNKVKGITAGATVAVTGGYSAGGEVEAIVAGIKKCKGKYRKGAKLYVAQDLYDTIMFAVDDNGRFQYPIFNANGISKVGSMPLAVDENLEDGDFIIGNVSKYFKANILIPTRIEVDRKPGEGLTKYVASCYAATVPHPEAFVHGTKSAT